MDNTTTGERVERKAVTEMPVSVDDFEINNDKTLAKQLQSSHIVDKMVIRHKKGGIVVTFNTATYALFKFHLKAFLDDLINCEDAVYNVESKDSTDKSASPSTYRKVIRVINKHDKFLSYTMNVFHTKSKIMVNGQGSKTVFVTDHLRKLTEFSDNISAAENVNMNTELRNVIEDAINNLSDSEDSEDEEDMYTEMADDTTVNHCNDDKDCNDDTDDTDSDHTLPGTLPGRNLRSKTPTGKESGNTNDDTATNNPNSKINNKKKTSTENAKPKSGKKSGKKDPLNSDFLCDENCKHDNKDIGESIQCTTCTKWFHCECVGLSNDCAPITWPCPMCRQTPKLIKDISTSLKEINTRLNSLQTQNEKLLTALSVKTAQCSELEIELARALAEKDLITDKNDDFSQLIAIPSEDNENKSYSAVVKEPTYKGDCLVIGSSIVGVLKNITGNNVDVKCYPGANIKRITAEVDKIIAQHYQYGQVIIHVGSIDCEESESIESIVSSYHKLMQTATSICKDKLIVSSILPRTDKKVPQAKIDAINHDLHVLTIPIENCEFVNHDKNFRCLNGEVIDDLLKDGLHLSHQGALKFAQNLGLEITRRPRIQTQKQEKQQTGRPSREQENGQSQQQQKRKTFQKNRTGNQNYVDTRYNRNDGDSRRRRPQTSRADDRKRVSHCYNCGETNHMEEDCRHQNRICCNFCDRMGHKEKMCWNR